MHNLVKRLEKRGWKKSEIIKAIDIIKNAKKDKPKDVVFIEKRVYWVLLVMIAAANFAISIALLPALIALSGFILYFVLVVLGFVFGLLFELVIRSIEHLESKHHFLLAALIPLIALANVFFMSGISNNLIKTLGLTNFHNSAVIAAVYSVAFVLPYIVYRFVLKAEYYAKE